MRTQKQVPGVVRGLAVCTAAAAALVTAGCGGNSGDEGSGSSRSDFEEAALDHAQCLREHGVDAPDPKPGQGGLILRQRSDSRADPEAEQRALEACEKYLADAPPPEMSEGAGQEMRDSALAHARCMRRQGIDFPDPKFDDGRGVMLELGDEVDPNDPAFRSAQRACARHLPGLPEGAP